MSRVPDPIDVTRRLQIPAAEVRLAYSRSGGPNAGDEADRRAVDHGDETVVSGTHQELVRTLLVDRTVEEMRRGHQ